MQPVGRIGNAAAGLLCPACPVVGPDCVMQQGVVRQVVCFTQVFRKGRGADRENQVFFQNDDCVVIRKVVGLFPDEKRQVEDIAPQIWWCFHRKNRKPDRAEGRTQNRQSVGQPELRHPRQSSDIEGGVRCPATQLGDGKAQLVESLLEMRGKGLTCGCQANTL